MPPLSKIRNGLKANWRRGQQIPASDVPSRAKERPSPSTDIWLYRNILTNQVVYSLSKVLKSKVSFGQLPEVTRRLHPSALRKDHWIPFACATFPDTRVAHKCFVRLLAFRQWRYATPPTEQELRIPVKRRLRLQMDQLGTSVADLSQVTREIKGINKIQINWANDWDVQYANNWKGNVKHVFQGFPINRGHQLITQDEEKGREGWMLKKNFRAKKVINKEEGTLWEHYKVQRGRYEQVKKEREGKRKRWRWQMEQRALENKKEVRN